LVKSGAKLRQKSIQPKKILCLPLMKFNNSMSLTRKLMIIRIVFILISITFFQYSGSAQTDSLISYSNDYQLSVVENRDTNQISMTQKSEFKYRESKRFVAAVLCLTLGPFGMHRLYLGATPQVAAAYSVTLGAIGILPVVDLLLISFSKDISRFKNNGKVIMWGK